VWKSIVELYRCRALIKVLISRDLKARYRGSILGFLWSLLNPCLMMLVYWLVFSIYMRFGMRNYHVFLFCGLLPWVWFSAALLEGCNAIISGGNLVKKVLFPAEILPMVVVFSYLVHFFLALPILLIFMYLAGITPGWNLLTLPVVILIQCLFTLAVVLMLSAFSVRYRDIQQILTNLITLWFFMNPIIYPFYQLPASASKLTAVMNLNPMIHIITAYHHIFLQKLNVQSDSVSAEQLQWNMEHIPNYPFPFDGPLPWTGLLGVAVFSVFLFYVSYRIFNRFKVSFSEEI